MRLPDLAQHAHEVLLRIEAVALGAAQQGVEIGVALARRVVADEEPVFSSDGHALQRPLSGVVVDVQKARRRLGAERDPLVEHVGDGRRHGASGQGREKGQR